MKKSRKDLDVLKGHVGKPGDKKVICLVNRKI